jgi:hypothetical protein
MEAFFAAQAEGKETGQEIFNSRKLRGFEDRLARERGGLETVAIQQEVLEKALMAEAKMIIDGITSELSRERGETVAEHDALKKRICGLEYEAHQLKQQLSKLDLQQENQRLQIKNVLRQWPPDRIIKLLNYPDDPEFHDAGNIIRFIPVIRDHWQRAVDKRNKEAADIRAKADAEHQALIKKNKEITDRALCICSGKEPMPPELATLYNHNTLELNVCIDFLKRKDQQAKAVK